MTVSDQREVPPGPVSASGAVLAPGGPRPLVATNPWRLMARRFRRDKVAMAGALVVVLISLSAVFAPLLARYPIDPVLNRATLSQARQPPSWRHPLGTDDVGRDQLTRILYGGRISLVLGLSVAIISVTVGTAVGAVAGYCGGWIDQALMRLTDLLLVIPGLAILMIAQKGLGRSAVVIVAVLSLLFWRGVARVVRSMMLSLREREFAEAARASGASAARVVLTELLPNAVGVICVQAPLAVAAAILTESTLSFLGFGLAPPTASWGSMLAQSRGAVGTHLAYLVYSPGVAILVTVLAINVVGNGLRDAFDPESGG